MFSKKSTSTDTPKNSYTISSSKSFFNVFFSNFFRNKNANSSIINNNTALYGYNEEKKSKLNYENYSKSLFNEDMKNFEYLFLLSSIF